MKIFLFTTLGIFLIAFLMGEIGLRCFFGFGNPFVYISGRNIGYLLAPNQQLEGLETASRLISTPCRLLQLQKSHHPILYGAPRRFYP